MLTIELMGPKALTYIDYVGWLNEPAQSEGEMIRFKIWEKDPNQSPHFIHLWILNQAQTHLSQTVNKHMFVRPEEPRTQPPGITVDGIEMDGYGDEEHEVWVKWKPMFEGSWRYDKDADAICYEPETGGEYWLYCHDYKGWSLDDFIRDLTKDGIPLFYHPEHELK